MLTGSDLNRLAIELNIDNPEFDVDNWAIKESVSDHAIQTLSTCFNLASENGVSAGGIALTAFYFGWEAHKQFGRYNNDASITGGS